MARTMQDSINAASTLPGADFYAGYNSGKAEWQSYQPLRSRYPMSRVLAISISKNVPGDVGDIERGDMTPADGAEWSKTNPGKTLYCQFSSWHDVMLDVRNAGQIQPPYLIAEWDGSPEIPYGAVGKQYATYQPNYDISSILDYWPGVDKPLDTLPRRKMERIVKGTGDGMLWLSISGTWELLSASDAAALAITPTIITDELFARIQQTAK